MADLDPSEAFFDHTTVLTQVGNSAYGLSSCKNRSLCAKIVEDPTNYSGIVSFKTELKPDMIYPKNLNMVPKKGGMISYIDTWKRF